MAEAELQQRNAELSTRQRRTAVSEFNSKSDMQQKTQGQTRHWTRWWLGWFWQVMTLVPTQIAQDGRVGDITLEGLGGL